MSNLDFGTWIAAIVAFGISVGAFLKMGFESVWKRLWDSIKALFGSPAVWFAAFTMLIVGFCVGYIDGVSGKRVLRAEVAQLRQAGAEREKALVDATNKVKALEADLATLKGKGAPDAKSEAVAADFKRPVVRAPKPKPAAGEVAKGQWWPFSN